MKCLCYFVRLLKKIFLKYYFRFSWHFLMDNFIVILHLHVECVLFIQVCNHRLFMAIVVTKAIMSVVMVVMMLKRKY